MKLCRRRRPRCRQRGASAIAWPGSKRKTSRRGSRSSESLGERECFAQYLPSTWYAMQLYIHTWFKYCTVVGAPHSKGCRPPRQAHSWDEINWLPNAVSPREPCSTTNSSEGVVSPTTSRAAIVLILPLLVVLPVIKIFYFRHRRPALKKETYSL